MNAMERVLTSLSHKEPDKVPLMQVYTIYGAKELGVSIEDYFSNIDNVIEAQVLMQQKYKNDCFCGFYYTTIELEAFGGKTIFFEDGPPNAGPPIIQTPTDIHQLKIPPILGNKPLEKILETIRRLKKESDGKIPVLGVVTSPFSLPVVQMGFDHYLDLMINDRALFWELMSINKTFAIQWANAQLEAGANAICYADPVSSPSIIPKTLYKQTGFLVAKEVLNAINGATATHFASGLVTPVIDDLAETNTNLISVSSNEDIKVVKERAGSRMAIMGNMNGIEMCHWTTAESETIVKNIIGKAAAGGGFLLSDNHGEIPYQVPSKVLLAIAGAVDKYGWYHNQ
jgi:uroporphyrinogen decarboxylase